MFIYMRYLDKNWKQWSWSSLWINATMKWYCYKAECLLPQTAFICIFFRHINNNNTSNNSNSKNIGVEILHVSLWDTVSSAHHENWCALLQWNITEKESGSITESPKLLVWTQFMSVILTFSQPVISMSSVRLAKIQCGSCLEAGLCKMPSCLLPLAQPSYLHAPFSALYRSACNVCIT